MGTGLVTLSACGDVMPGRGIDQILPHPGDPELREDYADDANAYVRLAERANGPISRRPEPGSTRPRPGSRPPGGGRALVFSCGTASSGIPPGWAATATRPGVDLLPSLFLATADALIARAPERL